MAWSKNLTTNVKKAIVNGNVNESDLSNFVKYGSSEQTETNNASEPIVNNDASEKETDYSKYFLIAVVVVLLGVAYFMYKSK